MSSQRSYSPDHLDDLLKTLKILTRVVDQVLEYRAVESASSEPLSSSKVQVLRLLAHQGGQTSSQVAAFLGVTKAAVSQLIDTMVGSKLVTRKQAVGDRREVALDLAPRGRQLFQTLRRKQRHLLRNALRIADRREAKQWIAALREIADAIARSDGIFKEFCLQCGAYADDSCVLVGGEAQCLYLQGMTGKPAKRR